jgi:putative ABC transport system permease protein
MLLGLRPSMVAYLYSRRLRSHAAQELLAAAGIAVGIALLVGVLASSATLTRAGDELIHGLEGKARLALVARSPTGFPEATAQAAGALPGVKVAVYVLRENASLAGPAGRAPVQLIGVTPNLRELGGAEVREVESEAEVGILNGGLGLPTAVARTTGLRVGETLTVLARGGARQARVRALLRGGRAGPLAASPVAITLLGVAQRLSGLPGHVSTVLIEPRAGQEGTVRRALERLAGGGLQVVGADHEEALLAQATGPSHQSTTLFAAIGASIGFLLALSAMLLTVPERRRLVAELQLAGYDWRQVALIIGSQVMALGLAASAVGVVVGEVLARTLFHQSTAGLDVAFPLGSREIVDPALVAGALAAGVLASLLASLPMAIDLGISRPANPLAGRRGGELIGARVVLGLAALGVALLAGVGIVLLLAPGLTIAGLVVAGAAVPCLVPIALAGGVRALAALSEHWRASAPMVAVRELRGTSLRAAIVASVVGLAVYSTTASTGGQRNLFSGFDLAATQYFGTAQIWVAPPDNIVDVNAFPLGGTPERIAALPGVRSVRPYEASLDDVRDARLAVVGRPIGDPTMIPPSQLLSGSLSQANARLRAGGWAAASAGFVNARHLHIGQAFTLPTPSGPARLRLAGVTTNFAWPPGAVTLNANDYRRLWRTSEASALEVDLKPGVPVVQGRREVAGALADRPGLRARSAAERIARNKASVSQQLESLTVISTLLLIAAAVAVALTLSAAIWQRRARLASLKVQGYDHRQLWRALLLESAIVLTVGWAVGIVIGECGHAFASRWLKLTTGFPVAFSLGGVQVLVVLGLVVGIAVLVLALPGLAAARVSPRMSFQE